MTEEPVVLVEWDNRYSVGIALIDDQHKELIRLTNDLYQGCLAGNEEAEDFFFKTVRQVLDYTKFHFSAEEKLMENVRYPNYAEHRKQHEDFVMQMLNDVKSFQEGKKFVPNNFVRYLKDWILSHIAIMDTLYAKYIHELKKQGTLGNVIGI
ncbi:MAG: bacteriohemerythrin [Treponema sp.]|jgi:hemerythrin|nr:bacteriohemerythrin [Treponema sp.]